MKLSNSLKRKNKFLPFASSTKPETKETNLDCRRLDYRKGREKIAKKPRPRRLKTPRSPTI